MGGFSRRFRRRTRAAALKQIEKLQKETITVEGGIQMTLDQLLMRLGQKDAIIFEYEVGMARAQQEIASLKEQVAGLEKAVAALQVKPEDEQALPEEGNDDKPVALPGTTESEEGQASA